LKQALRDGLYVDILRAVNQSALIGSAKPGILCRVCFDLLLSLKSASSGERS
jgi:hypothetical protein